MQYVVVLAMFFSYQLTAMQENARVFKVSDDVAHDASELIEFSERHHRKVVIVVDDNTFMRSMITKEVHKAGDHVVVEFSSGDQFLAALAIKKLRRYLISSCRLIVLDKQMPGKDGIEVMLTLVQKKFLQFAKGNRTVPVFLNTADDVTNLGEEIRVLFEKILKRKNSKEEIHEILAKVSPLLSPSLSPSQERKAILSKSCGFAVTHASNEPHHKSCPSSPVALKRHDVN